MQKAYLKTLPVVFSFLILFSGCSASRNPGAAGIYSSEILEQYPKTSGPLNLSRLTETSAAPFASSNGADVSIIVHPAYSIFFDNSLKKDISESKFRLIKKQFENEVKFIREQSRYGNIVILILPADSVSAGSSPSAFRSYLNALPSRSGLIYYMFSQTQSNGTLSMDNMLTLYRFLQSVKAKKALVGGGYIGRCQNEFLNQLVKYHDPANTYVVPEISTISPGDVSDYEAVRILSSIRQQDYTPIKQFINRKTEGNTNILSIPQRRDIPL